MATSSTFTAADGDGYELQMGRWSQRLAPLLIQFSGITAGERVLDVGCGTGSLSLALAENPSIRSVEGVDFSPEYVEYASKRSHASRPSFQVADACALPFPDASFDHALSMLVLQFIPDADRAVREMKRVTRPGGTVCAATWDTQTMAINRMYFGTAAEFDAKAREIRAAACARPMARSEGLLKAWHDVGLANVVQDALTISMDFASFADFWMPFEGRDGPYAQYFHTLDAERKAKLRSRVEAVYLNGNPDGPRSYPSTAWVVKGAAR